MITFLLIIIIIMCFIVYSQIIFIRDVQEELDKCKMLNRALRQNDFKYRVPEE